LKRHGHPKFLLASDGKKLNERSVATYRIETPLPLEQAAEALAGEQSSGTFVAVPSETAEIRDQFRARVEKIVPLENVDAPSLSGSKDGGSGPYHRAEVVVSWSLDNVGTNLPTLLATIQGNLYELREFSGLKLIDIDMPTPFAKAYAGPQFGVEGTRRLTGVAERPIVGTIVKPSVGLTPLATAKLVDELASADIDFIKDDELMADPPHSPFAKQVEAVMEVINRHADRTGKKVMFAFNITDEIDEIDAMRRHHDTVVEAGGTCVMVSLNSVGLPAVHHLRKYCQLPIHGHRNGWGMLTRHPWLGIEFRAYQKLWRLVDVDHLHVNAFDNKFWEPNESVLRSLRSCLEPMFGGFQAMPVLSSGQWGGQAPATYQAAETTDVMYLAGGGVIAHPDGPAAGVRRDPPGVGGCRVRRDGRRVRTRPSRAGQVHRKIWQQKALNGDVDRKTSTTTDCLLRRRLHRVDRRDGVFGKVRIADRAVHGRADRGATSQSERTCRRHWYRRLESFATDRSNGVGPAACLPKNARTWRAAHSLQNLFDL